MLRSESFEIDTKYTSLAPKPPHLSDLSPKQGMEHIDLSSSP